MAKDNSGFIYRRTSSEYFQNPAHIFSLDYYKKSSAGEHEFSRKQVWFYIYGDEDIKNEFSEQLKQLFDTVFDKDSKEWDILTVYPSFAEGGMNSNLVSLAKQVNEGNRDYQEVLRRTHTIRGNHELETLKEKVINLEGSINVEKDVRDKNIILLNNISLTGTSLMHATDMLKEAGAAEVACVCLGIENDVKEKDYQITDETAYELFQKSLEPITIDKGE